MSALHNIWRSISTGLGRVLAFLANPIHGVSGSSRSPESHIADSASELSPRVLGTMPSDTPSRSEDSTDAEFDDEWNWIMRLRD